MVQTTTKFRFRFDDQKMFFEEEYPTQLASVFPQEEFRAILRRLNYDLNKDIQESYQTLCKYSKYTAIACVLIIGILATPVLWYKASKNQKLMEEFWTKVRAFLQDINRQGLIRRGLEWKIVEDKSKIRGRDCINMVYCYRLDLVWRQGIVKSKRTKEREARLEASSNPSGLSTLDYDRSNYTAGRSTYDSEAGPSSAHSTT